MASRSFGICLRVAFVSMLAVWLAGCGLPPALAIISSAADGISFIATGKSFPDIALSAMTDKDCAVYRIITNNEICRDTIGDRHPAKAIVSADRVAAFAALDEPAEGFYMLRYGDQVVTASVADRATGHALLEGFAGGTELFALVQDDGTLEVFAHDPARADDRSNMRLIMRMPGYATEPESFRTLLLNGTSFAVEDIIV